MISFSESKPGGGRCAAGRMRGRKCELVIWLASVWFDLQNHVPRNKFCSTLRAVSASLAPILHSVAVRTGMQSLRARMIQQDFMVSTSHIKAHHREECPPREMSSWPVQRYEARSCAPSPPCSSCYLPRLNVICSASRTWRMPALSRGGTRETTAFDAVDLAVTLCITPTSGTR